MAEFPDLKVYGPALPDAFVRFDLEPLLARLKLWPKSQGPEARALAERLDVLRRRLRRLVEGGPLRVFSHVLEPLAAELGYSAHARCDDPVTTYEGPEDGGWLLRGEGDATLRVWALDFGVDLDAPSRRGDAYRFSPSRIAERVLDATGERIALLTNGEELRLFVRNAGNSYSHLDIDLGRAAGWRRAGAVPDSYRLVHALARPAGVARIHDLTEVARLAQTRVTAKLRQQAQEAVIGFVQGLLDDPENTDRWPAKDRQALAHDLWREAMRIVYRLLFILCLESAHDPARRFSFDSSSVWRMTYSPSTALAPVARAVLDHSADTGTFLGDGLRALFRLFRTGLRSPELTVYPLDGFFFGADAVPLLDSLQWSEHAVAVLLDRLLWTPAGKGQRERVHYGALDVEELGRVYEALLELVPGIADAPMARLRRAKLEIVVPAEQAASYRKQAPADLDDDDSEPAEDEGDEGKGKTRVAWVEDIPAGRYFLRVGLGRKATGSYYTPHPFVRFLLRETLGAQVAARSSDADPQPGEILKLNILDPAMGSGHFLVEACRHLGDKLYEACRLCDELAARAEAEAEKARREPDRVALRARATELRRRVDALPDPDRALLAYLPTRAFEGGERDISEWKARALCRRLVAVNCLYGVDKNPLAVELAKVALWLESYAEGLPLTFMNHRLLRGDSLTGATWSMMQTMPRSGDSAEDVLTRGLRGRLDAVLRGALREVADLEGSIGVTAADVLRKQAAKQRLDEALEPLVTLARAWSGGVMLGADTPGDTDGAYQALARALADGAPLAPVLAAHPHLHAMLAAGDDAVAFELCFPEVFFPTRDPAHRHGFDAVIGNPPWDALQPLAKEFYAAFDLRVLDAPTRRERAEVEKRLQRDRIVVAQYDRYTAGFEARKRLFARIYRHINRQAGGQPSGAVMDLWQPFAERALTLWTCPGGHVGVVLPSAFHANQSATGLRELYLRDHQLDTCFSFENVQKLFEIHASFKFALVAARHGAAAEASPVRCAFYLHDLAWLGNPTDVLEYDRAFISQTGGEYLSLMELRSPEDARLASAIYKRAEPLGAVWECLHIRCGEELHMSKSSHMFTPIEQVLGDDEDPRAPDVAEALRQRGYLPLYEGKHFHQYNDHWEDRPRYLVATDHLTFRADFSRTIENFRLALRNIASSTNERTTIVVLAAPGSVFGHSASAEREPTSRPSSSALVIAGLLNSFSWDWSVRQKSGANVSQFILFTCPSPHGLFESPRATFLAHAALRLTCNHAGYAPLWREQLGDHWREPSQKHTWPVLADDEARWGVRAAIDALVADAYGLSRAHYEHLLASFSHKSYPAAPARCLAAFDELHKVGLAAFTRAHDPYHDIDLVTARPTPILHLAPRPTDAPPSETTTGRDPPKVQRRLDGTFEPTQIGLLGPEPPPAPRPRGRPRKH